MSAMFFVAKGGQGMNWTLRAEYGIKDRNVMYTWGLGMRLRVGRWACAL